MEKKPSHLEEFGMELCLAGRKVVIGSAMATGLTLAGPVGAVVAGVGAWVLLTPDAFEKSDEKKGDY
jgi:hypothetical protein